MGFLTWLAIYIALMAMLMGPLSSRADETLAQAWQSCAPKRMQGRIEPPPRPAEVVAACSRVIGSPAIEASRQSVAYLHRGNALAAERKFDQSVADFSKAIKLDKANTEALFQRALAYLDSSKDKEAVADFTAYLQAMPGDAEAYNNRGVALAYLEQHDRAIADWTRAIALKPHYADPYGSRGYAYYTRNELDKALADFNEAIRWRPRHAFALAHRGLIYEKRGDVQKAKADYESVLRIPLGFGDSEAGHDIARERLPQLATLAPTAEPSSSQALPTPEALFSIAKRYVYIVLTKEAEAKISQGSAVAVSPNTFFTACHVLGASAAAILIAHDGRRVPATLRGRSPARDRCELVTDSQVTDFATIRSAPALAVGERVYAIGAPKALDVGLELSFTDGIVSSLRRENGEPMIQTSAPISSGSPGGGLFDAKGQLVGITVSTHKSAQNMNFAIPVDLYRF